jgi:peptide-methionine (R)-S-oxide reductase
MSPTNYCMGRRGFLTTLTGAMAVSKLVAGSTSARPAPKMVRIAQFDAAGNKTGVVPVEMVVKTEAEWRKQLSPLAFDVTRKKGTEYPGTGKYVDNHADGLYHCICCDTALFDSKTKFESGTGWPSFFQRICDENVKDRGLDSNFGIELGCARCEAHLGHLFDDGPKPTGLRFCINSVSLNFVPRKA